MKNELNVGKVVNEPYPSTEPTRACMGCGKIATIKQHFGRMVFFCCDDHAKIVGPAGPTR